VKSREPAATFQHDAMAPAAKPRGRQCGGRRWGGRHGGGGGGYLLPPVITW